MTEHPRRAAAWAAPFARVWDQTFSSSRGGRVRLALATGGVARLVAIGASLVATPLAIRYLGIEGYGLMVAISSVITWLGLSNFGMAQGLQNALTHAVATNQHDLQRALVSTAAAVICGIAVLLVAIWIPVSANVDWSRIFPPTSAAYLPLIPRAVQITFAGFLASFLLSFTPAIYAARQEVHLGNIAAVSGAIAGLAATLCVVVFGLGFLGMIFATVLATSLSNWTFVLWYFSRPALRPLRPSLRSVSVASLKSLYSSSAAFFVIQICSVALFQTEPFLLMHYLSPESVTSYNVASKLFLLAYSLFGFLAQPLWAAYGNATAHRDVAWIEQTHQRLLRKFYLFYSALFSFSMIFGRTLLRWWVGSEATPTLLLLALVGLYFGIRMWTDFYAVLVNGLDMMRPQAVSATVHAGLTLSLNVFLIQRLGVIGLPIGSFLGYLLISAWALPWMARRALAKLSPHPPPAPA